MSLQHGLTTQSDPEKLPWIERYRARHFSEIVGHDEDITAIRNLVKKNALTHFLFYGPPGTGKTSMILALAREIYGEENYKKYVKEINASSDRGIETIRGMVMNFIKTRSDKVKIIIMDEFDSMTYDAQSALRGVIEAYSGNNRFCLICNNINKVIPAIQSRCVKMRFSSLEASAIKTRLDHIISEEHVDIDDDAVAALIELETDFRQLLNLLQGIHALFDALGKRITKEDVYHYLGKPSASDIETIVDGLMNSGFDETYDTLLNMLRSNKWNIIDMVQHLLRKLLRLDMSIEQKHFLIEKLAEIEFRVRNSRDSEIQLAHLVSSFIVSRTLS